MISWFLLVVFAPGGSLWLETLSNPRESSDSPLGGAAQGEPAEGGGGRQVGLRPQLAALAAISERKLTIPHAHAHRRIPAGTLARAPAARMPLVAQRAALARVTIAYPGCARCISHVLAHS